ncbi:phage recombination protein Bet [Nesterenkonia sp. K-15-9-6]|uniref:phage recombination protein Bet n=1 Tax=Nesterenkonia sp. K-15-9-6 TaxID=3093918 RepID=UPI004043D146
MTDLTQSGTTDLTIQDGQTNFTQAQATALQHMGVRGATQADAQVFFHVCKRTGLDPFAKQIYMIERQGKQTIQTGIDGFRLIADRTTRSTRETLGYEDTQWCGPDGQWRDVWLSEDPPAAARVVVRRGGERFPGIALFSEYAARKRNGDLTQMWKDRPAGQLAKCAEALALRRAFPQDLSGLYTSDEMQQADNVRGSSPVGSAQNAQPAPSAASPVEHQGHPPAAGGGTDSAEDAPVKEPPREDPVEARMREAWNDVDQLRKLHKWMSSAHPDDARLAMIRQRGIELTQTQPDDDGVVDAEVVEEPQQAESLPIETEETAA